MGFGFWVLGFRVEGLGCKVLVKDFGVLNFQDSEPNISSPNQKELRILGFWGYRIWGLRCSGFWFSVHSLQLIRLLLGLGCVGLRFDCQT